MHGCSSSDYLKRSEAQGRASLERCMAAFHQVQPDPPACTTRPARPVGPAGPIELIMQGPLPVQRGPIAGLCAPCNTLEVFYCFSPPKSKTLKPKNPKTS
jgi:hypothetical protein